MILFQKQILQCDFQFSLQRDFQFNFQRDFQFSLQCNCIFNFGLSLQCDFILVCSAISLHCTVPSAWATVVNSVSYDHNHHHLALSRASRLASSPHGCAYKIHSSNVLLLDRVGESKPRKRVLRHEEKRKDKSKRKENCSICFL